MSTFASIISVLGLSATALAGYAVIPAAEHAYNVGVPAIAAANVMQHNQLASVQFQVDKGRKPVSQAELEQGTEYLDIASRDAQLAALNTKMPVRNGDWIVMETTQAECDTLAAAGQLSDDNVCNLGTDGKHYHQTYAPVAL